MCRREDYEHLGADLADALDATAFLMVRPGESIVFVVPNREEAERVYAATREAIEEGIGPASLVSVGASSTNPAGDATASLRAGAVDAPHWAVIHPGGRVQFMHGAPTYLDLRAAVGGPLEAVPHHAPEDLTGYCHEEGKLLGLPVNGYATAYLRVTGDVLVGSVAVIGGPDDEGNDTPLPAEARMRLIREVIEA